MPTSVATMVTDVLSRIRDTNATMMATDTPPTTATGRALVVTLLQVSQLFVNLAERLIYNEASVALSNNTALYDLPSNIIDYGGKVIACEVTDVSVIDGPVDYRALGQASFTWLTDTGTQIICWSPLGTDKIAFVPVFASGAPSVVISYLAIPGSLNIAGNIELPDDVAEHLARMTELLCLLKTRQLTTFQDKLQTLFTAMGAQDILRKQDDTGSLSRLADDEPDKGGI